MVLMAETRTAILTVDDDPEVSRAIARDLRRAYGKDYRIVRAESGDQGLEALRELKLRGDVVALLLADYRMPQMNGIEFLEQAMDLFPSARRVLLTAYADTSAAIDAINVVDLDHYLLKPWDPPEEKLYPVLDDLLSAWHASRPPTHSGHQGRGSPVVGSLVGRARVPRSQSGPLPLVSVRGSGGRATSRRRGCRWTASAGRHHRRRRGARRAHGRASWRRASVSRRRRPSSSTTWS